ncbi:Glycosyl hydrolase family 63 C-terminal domain-containing protein [Streptomyces sp. TLI_053]|uniref:amylo-alpha-1,6-glucosidase n=1 Tax=Streptomyces sp. TLI_053 TaxID=1855352 RepID=UPI00087D774E|nr:glycogen debranching protein [Streptomyces sp. TLI_053]SDT81807.1 Glycosyl hydrolase family 63 C-terminal domain-containing protein [Streptomyces sp. TLI_053]
MSPDPHGAVELDLDERPFTERGSWLLVTAGPDGLRVARAEYETRLADTLELSGLVLRDADGHPLPVRAATPTAVEFAGGAALLFADPVTLVLTGQDVHASWRLPDGTARKLSLDGCHVLLGPPGEWSAAAVRAAAEARWAAWFARMPAVRPDLAVAAATAWWTLAVNLLPIAGREGLVPSKYGYVGVWNWDALFHAVALRHADPALARDQILLFLDHQLPDGRLPDVVHEHGVLSDTTDLPRSDHARLAEHVGTANGARPTPGPVPVTKPPLAAWAVWKVHETAPDLPFLAAAYPRLVRAHRWWFAASDPDGDGLPEYLHPYSSGLDDSPVWDHGPRAEPPDLNSYLVLEADRLADIADALGRPDEAADWRSRAAAHTDLLVARRWDGTRFTTLAAGAPVPVRTALDLMPLFTGRLPADIAAALDRILRSPAFWGERPVPTVAFDDPAFDPEAMWRGPVWLNINYLLIEGLRRSGFAGTAAELRARTLAMVRDAGGLYEYWNPLTGTRARTATSGFGWSAALFVDLAAEG